MLDLSVIIPIYNTPTDALARCFASLESLNEISYEVLLVDDGSQETVGLYCRDFAEKHSAFRYVYKENGGVSSARNTGLALAQGRYITFLDADDALLGQAFSPALLRGGYDLVIFDIELIEKSAVLWKAFPQQTGDLSTENLLRTVIASKSLNGPVAKLYRRQLLEENEILFDVEFVNGEDWDFVCRFSLLVKTVYYCGEPCYRYFRDGATSKSRINRFPDVVLRNLIAMFRRKQAVLLGVMSHCEDNAELASTAASFFIENLFNSAADLVLLKKMTPARKALILDEIRAAAPLLLPGAYKKTRIKTWVITHFWVGVYPIAWLRELYLKFRT